MKKASFFLLLIAAIIGKSAQSQDTLRLFGHHITQPADKQTRQNTSFPPSDIQTLTGPGHTVGFYVGFHSEYSQVAGYNAFGAGGTIALIANHGLAIGFSGKGFITEPYEEIPGSNISYGYAGGYGGFLIEPIVFPRFPVHVSFPVLLGAGGISRSIISNYYYPYDYTEVNVEHTEVYLVAEPGMEIEFNVAKWIRLGLGGSYRFTTSYEPTFFKSNPLAGFTGGFSLKFGKF